MLVDSLYERTWNDLAPIWFQILKVARKLLGKTLFVWIMKKTFYGHFVAGEDLKEIKSLIDRNRSFGVKSILDYSVEEDLSREKATEFEMK